MDECKYTQQFDKLDTKLDKLDSRLDSIDITLIRQCDSLEYHIKRTNLLEEEIKPLKKFMLQILGVGKFLALVSLILSIIAAFNKFF